MQDDDGDFDDLYASPAFSRSDDGAGRTSTAPSAVTPPSSPAAAATVNNKRSSRRPNTAPSAVLEPRRRASSAGDGGRRKGSEELFDVHWEDDAGVKSCCRCAGAFSLLKRKHHCRHCGRVMCSDCSVFRYFEVSRKKHRVCTVCNKTLARANRPGDSDAEATDDGAEAGQATPSGSAARKRGKLREGLKKTFAPKEGRKKRAVRTGEAAKQAAGGGADADAALSASQAALPSEDELRSPADDLFDLEDDTWFADPRVVDAAKTERRQRGADLADDEFARDMYDNQTRYSVAPPKPRAAVNEWQDMRGRHTLAIGSAIPKGPGGSLPIDVYGSRGDDALERQRARMEMPRPEQHHVAPAVTRASLDEPSAANVAPSDDDRHPRERHTLKDGLKGMFHLHGKKDGARKRRSTLATKAPVANSAPAERAGVSTTSAHSTVSVTPQPPATTLARPTFYDANVDELVVDSSLGYFDYANNRDGSAAPAVAARQSRAGPDTSRWGEALRPASLEPRVVTSDQESYSIVESPTEVTPGAANGAAATNDPVTASTPVSEPGHRGLAGALKRFLGISGAKSTRNPLDSSADPGDARQGSGALVPPVEKERQVSAPASSQPAHTGVRRESASMLRGGSFDRYSMAERSMAEKSEAASRRDDTRFTMSGYAPSVGSTYQPLDPPSTRASTFPDAFASRDIFQKTRRDTFDELFESPTNRVGASSLKDASTARAWSGVGATASAMVPTTGVDRFDRRRDDSFSYLDAEPTVLAPTVYGVRHSRASSIGLGESSFVSSAAAVDSSRGAGNAWHTVSAVPSYGVATYAVPSSVPTDRFAASHDTDAFAASSTHTSIMDDIGHHRVPVASSSHQTNSVDDIFAEFERPNDYVFDPVSGGYVSASAPSKPRHVANETTRHSTQLERSAPSAALTNSDFAPARQLQRDQAPPSTDTERDDELDDTIVNKISSLEDELAALKQLIRQRKDHDHPVSTGRAPQSTTRHASAARASLPRASEQSARKLSIFDHDSSSDDEAAARQPSTKRSDSKAVLRASNVSPGDSSRRVSKKKTQRRRDSFADLFEDSPKTTGSGLGGGKGYESLFQSGSGKESGSDSDGASKTKSAKAPRRSSATPVADDDEDAPSLKARGRKTETQRLEEDDDEEEELTSLKHRSRSGADRRKPQPAAMSSSVGLFSESDEEETKPVARRAKEPAKPTLRAPTRPTKPSRPVMDDIDALFDSSSERDVTNFFDFATQTVAPSEAAHGSDSEEKDTPTAVVSAVSAITTRSTGDVAPGASLSDSDEDFAPGVAKATKRRSQPCVDAKATVAETTIAATTESGSNAVDSDEEFSSMLKSTRSRSLQSTSVATIPPTIRGVAATASALENTNDSDKNAAGVSVGGLDEEFTLQLSQTKTKRVKSVSFVDATQCVSESEPSVGEEHGGTPDQVGERTKSVVLSSVQVTTVATEFSSVYEAPTLDTLALGLDTPAVSDRVDLLVLDAEDNPDSSKAAVVAAPPNEPTAVPMVVSTVVVSTTAHVTDANIDDDVMGMFDRSRDLYSVHLGSTSVVDDDSDDGSDAGDAEAFSFEVKPKQRTARAPVASVEPLRPKKHAAEDEDDGVLLLGRYSTPASVSASVSQVLPLITGDDDTDTSALTAGVAAAAAEVLSESALQQAGVASDTDGDWRQLQEQEKERRKKLQLKQRQAQREKLLQSKKQGASSKQLNPPGSSASASSEKKKKAKKDRASAAADSSAAPTSSSSTTGARKKSSSASKKHKSTAKDDSEDTIDSTRTEL